MDRVGAVDGSVCDQVIVWGKWGYRCSRAEISDRERVKHCVTSQSYMFLKVHAVTLRKPPGWNSSRFATAVYSNDVWVGANSSRAFARTRTRTRRRASSWYWFAASICGSHCSRCLHWGERNVCHNSFVPFRHLGPLEFMLLRSENLSSFFPLLTLKLCHFCIPVFVLCRPSFPRFEMSFDSKLFAVHSMRNWGLFRARLIGVLWIVQVVSANEQNRGRAAQRASQSKCMAPSQRCGVVRRCLDWDW